MMICSVHLNQRFWKNLSRLRALVSQRRKSHKGWQRRFIDIYVDIYMWFRILLLYDGQYQEMVHTKFSVLSMWLRFSITDQFPFYQFIVGASARTLWYWYHRLIFRTCLIPIFRANSLLPHLLQDTQEEYFFTIGIEGAPQGPERGLEDQCFSKFLDEWLPKD